MPRGYNQNNLQHGYTSRGQRPSIYNTWRGMKKRCYRAANKDFANYGGRGITVCDRWRQSFAAFASDMGPKPTPAHSIDRINNDGNYEPSNCRWATVAEQHANKRNPRPCERNSVSGENNPRATITRQMADIIRVNCDAGAFTHTDIAIWFHVKRSLVSDIAHRRCWN